jgi:holliday junction DNA helicase RuvA
MIGHLKGQVIALGEEAAIVSTGGTGWKVEANGRTLSRLAIGQPVELWIETLVREDAIRLFGFLTDEERAWFVRLQDAQGVGARHALSTLDVLTPAEIMDALTLGDAVQFTRVKGVGKRLAEKLVLELKGKAPPQGFFVSHSSPSVPATARLGVTP